MGKLFNLKEWLTVSETARHLTIVFGEEVNDADVLRLALDGRLRLSVYFVNHAHARCGHVVGRDGVVWYGPGGEPSSEPHELQFPGKEKSTTTLVAMMMSKDIGGGRFLNLQDEISTLSGIWDLPMIGAEYIDVEHAYQNLVGGPPVTLQNLDGVFVEGKDGTICQLQVSFDDNEYQDGSLAALEKIKRRISRDGLQGDEAQKLLDKHREQRKTYLAERRSREKSLDYHPAGGLPEDGVLVVTTEALREFEGAFGDETPAQQESNDLSETERNSLLKMVYGMAVSAYQYSPNSKKNSATGDNKGSIAADLASMGLDLDSDTIRKFIKEAENRFGRGASKPDCK